MDPDYIAALKVHRSMKKKFIRQTSRKAKDMAGYLPVFSSEHHLTSTG